MSERFSMTKPSQNSTFGAYPKPESRRMQREYAWAFSHYSELARRYPDQWVAFARKKVLASGSDLSKFSEKPDRSSVGPKSPTFSLRAGFTFTLQIQLEVIPSCDLEALEHGVRADWHRLFIRTHIETVTGWSPLHRAVLDTGSPYCVIPQRLLPDIRAVRHFKTRLSGIVPGSANALEAELVAVRLILADGRRVSKPIEALSMITTENRVPLIIGLSAFQERFNLRVDLKRKHGLLIL